MAIYPSQSPVTRPLNTIFQISDIRNCTVSYYVDISSNLSLTGGQAGRVILEISMTPDFSSGVQEIGSFGNGNTGSLTIGLNINQNVTACLTGYIMAGNYLRIRTVNTTGTPTFTYRSGQEVIL